MRMCTCSISSDVSSQHSRSDRIAEKQARSTNINYRTGIPSLRICSQAISISLSPLHHCAEDGSSPWAHLATCGARSDQRICARNKVLNSVLVYPHCSAFCVGGRLAGGGQWRTREREKTMSRQGLFEWSNVKLGLLKWGLIIFNVAFWVSTEIIHCTRMTST